MINICKQANHIIPQLLLLSILFKFDVNNKPIKTRKTYFSRINNESAHSSQDKRFLKVLWSGEAQKNVSMT